LRERVNMRKYRTIEGVLQGEGKKFAIVISRFNDFITGRLLEGAADCLARHGVDEEDIAVIWVPGAFEIPMIAKKVAKTNAFDAILCLGAVIRGSTPHFDYVCAEVSKGVAAIGMDTGVPTIFGVVTTETIEQAIERAGTKAGNKGWEAAISALEMANLNQSIEAL